MILKLSEVFFISISLLCFVSCSEDFSPKTKLHKGYIVNCVIKLQGRSVSSAVATAGRIYDTEGTNPDKNTVDPSVSGAKFFINYNGTDYSLSEEIGQKPSTRYSTKPVYYFSNTLPISAYSEVYLEAMMPDRTILTAKTRLPGILSPRYSFDYKTYVHGFTTRINKFIFGEAFTISWNREENHIYFPKLYVNYLHNSDSGITAHTQEIPITYVKQNGTYNPVYPGYTYGGSVSYDYSAIDTAMARISQGDTAKGNYIFNYIYFSIIEFDEPLSNYYSSTHGSLDNYSIKLDESVYSNIKGGIGIFGSQQSFNDVWSLGADYIHLFGYKWQLEHY